MQTTSAEGAGLADNGNKHTKLFKALKPTVPLLVNKNPTQNQLCVGFLLLQRATQAAAGENQTAIGAVNGS